ncbi:MAG: hypothetical protein JNL01_01420 [Bdellovibrionales bacterium]|nr:hypothetical protein [Bdellovibrionales bacterium]
MSQARFLCLSILVVHALHPLGAQADGFESRTLISSTTFQQSIDLSRHIFLNYDDGGMSPDELRQARVNEEEEFIRIKKPSPIAWNLGYAISSSPAVAGKSSPTIGHSFQVGLVTQVTPKITVGTWVRGDIIPAEDLRVGEVELNVGNLELLQFTRELQMEGWPPGPYDPELDAEEVDQQVQSDYQRLFRNQILRDERARRKENRDLLRPKKPRRFERRALYGKFRLIFGTAVKTPPLPASGISNDQRLFWGSLGPELFLLSSKTFTARFSGLATLYQSGVIPFMSSLSRPEIKLPLPDLKTGLSQIGPYYRGFHSIRLAAGFIHEASSDFLWTGDAAISNFLYGNARWVPAGGLGFMNRISKDWNWGLDANVWVVDAVDFAFSLRTSLAL